MPFGFLPATWAGDGQPLVWSLLCLGIWGVNKALPGVGVETPLRGLVEVRARRDSWARVGRSPGEGDLDLPPTSQTQESFLPHVLGRAAGGSRLG